MSGITLAQAQAQLARWLEADAMVASGQAYTIQTEVGSRSLTRANASEITRKIDYWNEKVRTLSAGVTGRSRARTIVPGF